MDTKTQLLEEKIKPTRPFNIIDRRYAYYTPSREQDFAYLVYIIAFSPSCDFGIADLLSRKETLSLRDQEKELPAGVRSNSYFWKDGERNYVVGVLYGLRNQVRKMLNSLRESSFEEVNLPNKIIIPIGRTAEDQRAVVLPLVQPENLPVPYQALLAYLGQ